MCGVQIYSKTDSRCYFVFFYSESIVVYDDTEVEKKYLSLEELGTILEKLSLQLSGM